MVDVHTAEIRSKNMAAIRSANTKPERFVFKELRKRKIYFKKHYLINRTSIDIALPKKKIAVFIDGNFWHGYNFSKLKQRLPKGFWVEKIENNIKRDKAKRSQLKKEGWKILRIWEHDIEKKFEKSVAKIIDFLKINE